MNAPASVAADLPFAIDATGLGKAYQPKANAAARLRSALLRREVPGDSFWALRDVSLQVPRGESLGIIGCNGAGKSTLLQLVCGTVTPTTGAVNVNGRVAALLELGAGFNADFSGRDNVLLNGPLLGLGRQQLVEKMDSIIEFSGIGRFIDQPVKTYSSGMFVRLAFSLAISVNPDILVIDEALSVGDGGFARKSFDRILAMKRSGTTIVFCSHALYQVEAFCDRVMWLDQGRIRALGAPQAVVREYTLFLAGDAAPAASAVAAPGAYHARRHFRRWNAFESPVHIARGRQAAHDDRIRIGPGAARADGRHDLRAGQHHDPEHRGFAHRRRHADTR
jgi:lipopolysaccharide transport system ATP-binding protein